MGFVHIPRFEHYKSSKNFALKEGTTMASECKDRSHPW